MSVGHDHLVVLDSHGSYFIISAHPCKQSVFLVIAIDPLSGSIISHGAPGYDLFFTQQEALSSFEHRGLKIVKKIIAKAILGFISLEGGVSYLLIATKTREDTNLPGGHVIHTVLEHSWLCSSTGWLNGVLDLGTQQKMLCLQSYPLAGTHYYCASYDITRPYPSTHSVDNPDTIFCWNNWMRQAFTSRGLGFFCVPLLQGMAFSAEIPIAPEERDNCDSRSYGFASFILRRNQQNAGTKYYTSGMNEHGVPGNESELEILLWTFKHAEQPQSPQQPQAQSQQPQPKHKKTQLDSDINQPDEVDPELVQLDQLINREDKGIKETDTDELGGDKEGNQGCEVASDKDKIERGVSYELDKDKEARKEGAKANKTESDASEQGEKHIRWAGYVWRRGMVPLWWQILPQPNTSTSTNATTATNFTDSPSPNTQNVTTTAIPVTNAVGVASSGGEASIGDGSSTSNFFSANGGHTAALTGVVHHNPFQQCVAYYQSVLQCYDSLAHLLLLRPASLDYQEAALSDLLGESLKHVMKTFGKPIEIIEFDWISSLRTAGLHGSVEHLYSKIGNVVKAFGFSCGSDASGKVLVRRQTGIVRLACADSLDRSHMVNFFLTLPIVAELAKSVALLPSSNTAFAYFEQSLESVTRVLKNIGLLDIVTTVFAHLGDVGSILFANQLAGAPIITAMLRGYTSVSKPLLLELDHRLHSQRSYVLSNTEATRNTHYQLFLGLDSPPPPLVLVSHNSLVLTTYSTPPLNPRHFTSPLSRMCTMVIILPHPAYVYELVVRGAGGYKMSVSLGSYEDPHTHTLSLHGVLIPHTNSALVFTLPASPFKTHSNEYMLPYHHRPTRVVKLTFTYNWQPVNMDLDKTAMNNSEKSKSPPKSAFNFSFPNFGASNELPNGNSSGNRHSHRDDSSSKASNNFTKPYVGLLGYWVGVLDILSSSEVHLTDPTSSREFGEGNRLTGTSISSLADNSMTSMCVSRAVDDIVTFLETPGYDEPLTQSTPTPSPSQTRSPTQSRSQSPNPNASGQIHQQRTTPPISQARAVSVGGSEGIVGNAESVDNNGRGASLSSTPTLTSAVNAQPPTTTVAAAAAAAASAVTSAVTSITATIGGTFTASTNKQRSNSTSFNVDNNYADTTFTGTAKLGKDASNTDKYRAMVESQRPLGFTHALELECFRIQLGLDERTRDTILASLGCPLELYDPSHYQFHRDEKTENTIRKARLKTAQCQVGSQNCTGSFAIFGRKQCAYCGKRSCTNCIAGTAERVVEYKWDKPTHVCVFCANEISRQTHFIALLKAHSEIKSTTAPTINPSANESWSQMIAAVCANAPHISRNFIGSKKPDELNNCAEFPQACIVKEVPTDTLSPPIESVLFSHSHAPLTLFWQAPPTLTSVNVIIALPFVSVVSELALLVDAKGYTTLDAPILSVCVGHTLESVEHFLAANKRSKVSGLPPTNIDGDVAYGVGEWAVDMEGYTPCSTLIFTFPEPRECQIVAIKFSLPSPDSNMTAFSQTPPSPKSSTPSPTHSPMLSSDTTQQKPLKLSAPVPPQEHVSPLQHSPATEPHLSEQLPMAHHPHTPRHSHHPRHTPHSHHAHHLHHPYHQSYNSHQPAHTEAHAIPQLHIGRIRIHGTFSSTNSHLPFPLTIFNPTFSPPSQTQLQQSYQAPQSLARSNSLRSGLNNPSASSQPPEGWKPITPVSDLARGKSLEITVSSTTGLKIVGFGLTVQHTGDGAVSQVRELRVTALSTNSRSEICAFHNLCRILVPKTSPNTTLYFDIPSPPISVIMFEFLSSYGSPDAAPCTINLFN